MKDALVNFLMRLPAAVAMRLRIGVYRLLGVKIGKGCWIQSIMLPRNPWDVEIKDGVALDRHVVLVTCGARLGSPRIVIGQGTYINRFTMIDASERIEIGENCMIGPHCYVTDHNHGCRGGRPIKSQPLDAAAVSIGDDVWIGAGVHILRGVTIGDGAVIGAGSVVLDDVPSYAKVVGVPAREIGVRIE
jgi:acetyltransferase-like isoleucine patch superfamily enzyme